MLQPDFINCMGFMINFEVCRITSDLKLDLLTLMSLKKNIKGHHYGAATVLFADVVEKWSPQYD